MFEDAMMESGNRISTHSTYYTGVGVLVNASMLAALVLLPLLYPSALPRASMTTMLVAPPPPSPPPPSPVHIRAESSAPRLDQLQAPAMLSKSLRISHDDASVPQLSEDTATEIGGGDSAGTAQGIFDAGTGGGRRLVVAAPPPKKVIVSQGVMAGNILARAEPAYPAIARAARIQGIVVLSATISKAGAIENLAVVSGPAMLAQAAIAAVRQWRYKPYLLNGAPVEVQTQINVTFTLGG